MGGEGHGRLVYKYTWSIGCCATWCNTPVPSSCCLLVAFKPLNLESLDILSIGHGLHLQVILILDHSYLTLSTPSQFFMLEIFFFFFFFFFFFLRQLIELFCRTLKKKIQLNI